MGGESMKKYIYLIITVLLAVGCEDFLKPKSENEFVPTTVQALDEMLLYETYANQRSGSIPFFDLLSDDAAVVRFSGTESNLLTQVRLASIKALFTWQPDLYKTFEEDHLYEDTYDIYSGSYARILGCNATLDYADRVEGNEADRARVKAEAHALRAFWYFHVVNSYGQPYNYDKSALGVPLHLVSKVSSTTIPRNTVEEVYNQVVADLLEAERLYASVQEKDRWKANMRVSLPFVQLLLSRVYLYMENWEQASAYADKVIANPQFRLLNVSDFPSAGTYMYFHNYTNPEVIWPYGNAAEFRDFVDPYMIDISKGGKVSFVVADAGLLALFNAPSDIRKTHYLVPDSRSTNYKAFGKLAVTGSDNSPDVSNRFARSFRLSEAYLNKAEAEAMLFMEGKGGEHKQEALRLLKELWSHRLTSPGEAETDQQYYLDERTAATFLQSVRKERRRELCFEDHRWFDLRRQGMPKIGHTWMGDKSDAQQVQYTLKKNDPMYTLQIPVSVMLKNDQLIQNPAGPARVD